jgi:transposase
VVDGEEGSKVEVLFERVAGLDIGKKTLTVSVRTPGPRGGRRAETRTFSTMTRSLQVMRDWLAECGVTHAAMESTSTYWTGAFYCLVVSWSQMSPLP